MKIWYVDLPNPHAVEDDSEWVNVAVVKKKREAIKLLEDRWGIPEEHSGLFITAGEE